MVEPFTMATLGVAALKEGIKFLYGQASDLLKARRARKAAVEPSATIEIVVPESAPLDRPITSLIADARMIEEQHERLKELADQLAPYSNDWEDVEPGNNSLVQTTEQLRTVLEQIFGQRLTFAGEGAREPSGTKVQVHLSLGKVTAEAAGIHDTDIAGGSDVSVTIRADEVADGGKVIGIDGSRIY